MANENENISINYAQIVKNIQDQFNAITSEQGSPFAKLDGKVFVNDEQNFIKIISLDQNAIYIVVKFSSTSVNFAATVIPITLVVFATENKIKVTQSLVSTFATKYNLDQIGMNNIGTNISATQIWNTPSVVSNFVEAGSAFRSLFTSSGYLVTGANLAKLDSITYVYGDGQNDREELNIVAYSDNFNNALAPQPFPNTYGFARSITNFSTFGFSISTYSMNSRLVQEVLAMKGFKSDATGAINYCDPNKTFTIELNFSNGYKNYGTNVPTFHKEFHVHSVSFGQKIGSIPTITIGFSH